MSRAAKPRTTDSKLAFTRVLCARNLRSEGRQRATPFDASHVPRGQVAVDKGFYPWSARHFLKLFVASAAYFGRGGSSVAARRASFDDEVCIEAAGREPRFLHNFVYPGRVVPLAREDLARCLYDLRPGLFLVTGRVARMRFLLRFLVTGLIGTIAANLSTSSNSPETDLPVNARTSQVMRSWRFSP